jgi:ribosomal protein S17
MIKNNISILDEIKYFENKYEKLNKKFRKLKILKTKNNSYLEKDK